MAVSPAPNGDDWTTTFCFPLPLPLPPPPPIGLVGWEECLVPAKEPIGKCLLRSLHPSSSSYLQVVYIY